MIERDRDKEELINELIQLRKRNQELELFLREKSAVAPLFSIKFHEEKRFKAILDAIPLSIVLVDAADRKFLYVNRRGMELYGSDYIGYDLDSFIAKVNAQKSDDMSCPLEDIPVSPLKYGEIVRNSEMTIKSEEDKHIPILVSSSPLYDSSGVITHFIVIFEDISERRWFEESLEVRSQKINVTLDGIQYNCYVRDYDWSFAYAGKQFTLEYAKKTDCSSKDRVIPLNIGHKKLEEELKQQKDLLEAVIENMNDVIIIYDKAGSVIYINAEARKQYPHISIGTKVNDVHNGMQYFDLDNNPILVENLPTRRVLRGEKIRNERVIGKLPGKTVIVEVNAVPIFNGKNNLISAVVSHRDVSKMVECEEKLKEQNKQLEGELADTSLLQGISMELLCEGNIQLLYERIIDAAMQIMRSEYASLQMLHIEHDNGCRLELLAFRGFNPQAAKFWEWVYAESGSTCGEALRTGNRVITSNVKECGFMQGTEDQVICFQTGINAVQTTPLYSRSGRMVGMISTHWREPHYPTERELKLLDVLARQAADIMEQKYYQEKLLKAEREKNEALEKAIEMKDEFLSLVSHEFRTPLNVINTAIQALNSVYANEMTEKIKEYIGTIKKNVNRQLRLVNNLLDITRANAGRIKINKKNLDIVFLTKAITESVYEFASYKGVRVTFVSALSKKMIGIDDEKYERIILNLLSNAIKFTPEGKSIVVNLHSSKGNVCIEVKDNGIGIPPNKIGVIFERFGQVDSSLSRQAEGTGIGLSLVKKFVEALNGSISVKSKIGKGSTFTILLPNETVAEEQDEKPIHDLMMDNRLVQITNIEFSDIYS
ncbi:sensor histidine kinase TodS [Oxobacter pfennigii]|uniref:histidine kinase n=1 Tax=Oxobacter pfennigii TaxID=36849 RepID=A0A0P8YT09_9CLOT|nr:ATP-binding protein [Oxobacter pfennigii]KPU42817.1 sensor histidine kinase TodS [Oxobacter pfennigii]